MKNIRQGNDITLEWTIRRDNFPERFEGKEVKVQLLNYQREEQKIDYRIIDNRILVDFYGKDQSKLGVYTIVLTENDNNVNMATLDYVEAFRLVEHSYMEGGEDSCPNLKTETVKLESNFTIRHDVNVIDDLKSHSKKDALSANQGRVLDEKINQTNKAIPMKVSSLENDSNYTSKTYVDEANRQQEGKILANKKKNDEQDEIIGRIPKEYVRVRNGYDLSKNDFNDLFKAKLEQLSNYNDEEIRSLVASLKRSLDTLWEGSASEAIDNFREIEAFLQGFTDKDSLTKILLDYIKRKDLATINGQDLTKGGNIIIQGSGEGGSILVEDNLMSESINSALSANQGRVLKGMVDEINVREESFSVNIGLLQKNKADKDEIADMLTKAEARENYQKRGNYALKEDIPSTDSFITDTVDNLKNYYKKSETYTQEEVNTRLGAITTINFKKVEVKPIEGESNIIYLVPSKTRDADNIYEEWIYVDAKWELIGSTKVDLTNYYDKKYVDETLAKKTEIPKALSQLTDDTTHRLVTDAEKSTWNGKQPKGDYATKSELPKNLSELKEDNTHRLVSDIEKVKWNEENFFNATNILTSNTITLEDKNKVIEAIKNKKVIYIEGSKDSIFTEVKVIDNNEFYLVSINSESEESYNLFISTYYSNKDAIKSYRTEIPIKLIYDTTNIFNKKLSFYEGINKVSTLANLPINKRSIVANVTTTTEISLSGELPIGSELYIKVFNIGDSPIEQTIPNNSTFDSMSGNFITIPPKSNIEISIWCYDTNKYSIKAGGKL